MIKIVESTNPEDYVLATGIQHSVREFFILAAKIAGFKIEILGEGINEIAVDTATGKTIMKIDPIYFRPNEVPDLCGDYSKARKNLGWSPQVSFEQLVEEMVLADLNKLT
jgi:GDPmannose 4,6-dehydratase